MYIIIFVIKLTSLVHVYFPRELNKNSKFKKDNTSRVPAFGEIMEVFALLGV